MGIEAPVAVATPSYGTSGSALRSCVCAVRVVMRVLCVRALGNRVELARLPCESLTPGRRDRTLPGCPSWASFPGALSHWQLRV